MTLSQFSVNCIFCLVVTNSCLLVPRKPQKPACCFPHGQIGALSHVSPPTSLFSVCFNLSVSIQATCFSATSSLNRWSQGSNEFISTFSFRIPVLFLQVYYLQCSEISQRFTCLCVHFWTLCSVGYFTVKNNKNKQQKTLVPWKIVDFVSKTPDSRLLTLISALFSCFYFTLSRILIFYWCLTTWEFYFQNIVSYDVQCLFI